MEHINNIIDSEEYNITEQYVQCVLMVGEAPVIGISYRFSKATFDPERAKQAAREDAIKQLFGLEAYHQKRLRKVSAPNSVDEAIAELANSEERDVKLTFGNVDCQSTLKEYAGKLGEPHGDLPRDLAELGPTARRIAELGKRTILRGNVAEVTAIADSPFAQVFEIKNDADLMKLTDMSFDDLPKVIFIDPSLTLQPNAVIKKYQICLDAPAGTLVLDKEKFFKARLASKIDEYEKRNNEHAGRGCVFIEDQCEINELSKMSELFRPKRIFIDIEFGLDLTMLKGYTPVSEGRSGYYEA